MVKSMILKRNLKLDNDKLYYNIAFVILTLLHINSGEPNQEIKDRIQQLVEILERGQGASGGWFYLNILNVQRILDQSGNETNDDIKRASSEFEKQRKRKLRERVHSSLTALCVITLLEAKHQGLKVSDKVLNRGIKNLKDIRIRTGAFPYYISKSRIDTIIGSAARNPACELALYLAGESDLKKLEWSVANFFQYQYELENARKKGAVMDKWVTHIGRDAIGGFYFFFGHYWTVQALHYVDPNAKIQIDRKDKSKTLSPAECFARISKLMLDIRGTVSDGRRLVKSKEHANAWLDSWSGYQYGTAMALLVMSGKKFLKSQK